MVRLLMFGLTLGLLLSQTLLAAEPIRVGAFDVDASPPVGMPLAYDPTKGVETPLSCRGIVLAGAGQPIVLCSIDWIGISNGGQTAFREGLAKAVGTVPQRVAVHTVHQHDAPRCDFSADELLSKHGLGGVGFDPDFARDVVDREAAAVKTALENAKPATHVGIGSGVVEKVASNRRILGPDGKVKHTRWTATRDPKIRAFPVGTIDPQLKMISFWGGDEPIAALTYYATHPQSYYRTGLANPDFPGLARNARQQETGVPHIHFNGAGGDIGAGKWNDGSPQNRQVLADRVAAGMKRAWENTKKSPLSTEGVGWSVEPVVLPASEQMDEAALIETVEDANAKPDDRWYAAKNLIWLRRCRDGDPIDIACLRLNAARVLHMPGELTIDYQLAAGKLQPDLFVAMAAYGEYAPGYIATEIAYTQGGYEASPRASKVAPAVEGVLMKAIGKLLEGVPAWHKHCFSNISHGTASAKQWHTTRRTHPMAATARRCLPAMFVAMALLLPDVVDADVDPKNWHHRVEIPRPPRKGKPRGPAVGNLWIPPKVEQLRGLIVAEKTLLEKRLVTSSIVRKAATDESLGILYFEPGPNPFFPYGEHGDCDRRFLKGLDELAKKARRPDIRRVAWLTIGHSTGGIFCRNLAYWQPDRVLGVIHIKSGNMHHGIHYPKRDSLEGVPFLAINGEFEEHGPEGGIRKEYGRQTQWVMIRKQMLARRRESPEHLMSLIVHPGGDHTDWSDDLTRLCAMFIRKACANRLPEDAGRGTKPIACRKIDVASGWLTDGDLKKPKHEPAAHAEYTGDRGLAFWHFDEQMARAVRQYHQGKFTEPDPAIAEDKHPAPGDDRVHGH